MSKIYTRVLTAMLFVLGTVCINVNVVIAQCANTTSLPAAAQVISTTGATTTITSATARNVICTVLSGQYYFVTSPTATDQVTTWGTTNGTGLLGSGLNYNFTTATTGTTMWANFNTSAACNATSNARNITVNLLPYNVVIPATPVCIGNTITITGNALANTNLVTFTGGVTAVPSAVTATSFNVTIPAGALSGPVTLRTTGGAFNITNGGIPGSLDIRTSVGATSTPAGGAIGEMVTINGNNLLGSTNMRVNGVLATGVTVTATSITGMVAPGTTGTGNVTFTDGCSNAVTASAYTVVTATNYYSKATGNLDLLTTWGTNTDGTGTNPPDFTTAGGRYNIQNNATPTIGAAWAVSGTGSFVYVGDGISACNFTVPATFAFTGIVANINANATLTLANATLPTLTGAVCALTSTVNYSATSALTIPAVNYGNVTFSGASGNKTFAAGCSVAGTFTVNAANTVILNATTTARTFNINNFVQSGTSGTINPMSSSGVTTVNISGNFSQTAGTMITSPAAVWNINFNGGATQTLTTNSLTYSVYTISNNTTVNLGSAFVLRGITGTPLGVNAGSTLDAGTFLISTTASPVNITVNGTLKTANTAGLSGSASTTIVNTNTPTLTLGSASSIVYNANSASSQAISARSDYANLTVATTGAGGAATAGAATATSLTLTSGIATTTALNTLSVTGTANTAITGGSTTSFVSGPLKWSLPTLGSPTSYIFPVGSGGVYLPMTLIPSNTTTPAVTVQAFNIASGGAGDCSTTGTISGTEYWNATINSGTWTDGSVSLTRQAALGTLNIIGRSATQTGTYVSLGGTVAGTSINNSAPTGAALGFFAMAGPTATVDAGTPQTICAGSTVALAGAYAGAATSASWSGGAGTFTPNANAVNAVYTPTAGEITAGSVTLTLTTNDPAGPCGAAVSNVLIIINPSSGSLVSANSCENMNVGAGAVYTDAGCNAIAKVEPSGATPVSGMINTCATIDAVQMYYNSAPYVQRHIDIEPATNAVTATGTVTLYFTDAEFVNYNTNNPTYPLLPTVVNGGSADPNRANLRITQYHGTPTTSPSAPGLYTGAAVVLDPADADITYNGNFWEVKVDVSGFSGFYVYTSNTGGPLPISINYFTGAKQGNGHLLDWKITCNATPKATMVLERSADSRNFNTISTVVADAARCDQPFTYTDAQPLKGMNYYRLKMIDIDGKVSYSGIVALLNAVKGFDIISIAPNPVVNGNFKLNVTNAVASKMDIIITDMQGRLVNKQTVPAIAGFNSIPVNVSQLAAGTYAIQVVVADERSVVTRFVKQ